MTDRYRHHSNAAAIGVLGGLMAASIATWATFAIAIITIL